MFISFLYITVSLAIICNRSRAFHIFFYNRVLNAIFASANFRCFDFFYKLSVFTFSIFVLILLSPDSHYCFSVTNTQFFIFLNTKLLVDFFIPKILVFTLRFFSSIIHNSYVILLFKFTRREGNRVVHTLGWYLRCWLRT